MYTRPPVAKKDKKLVLGSRAYTFILKSTYLSLSYIRCVSPKQILFLNDQQCVMLQYEGHATK